MKTALLLATTLTPWALTGALSASDGASAAQEPPGIRVAVLPVENATGDAAWDDGNAIVLGIQKAPASEQEKMLRPGQSRDPSQLDALPHRVRNGDPVAQVELANTLLEEQPPRHEAGMHWLRKAAERDYARAQRLYAWSLVALRQEDATNEAVTWLARAADQGDIESQAGRSHDFAQPTRGSSLRGSVQHRAFTRPKRLLRP